MKIIINEIEPIDYFPYLEVATGQANSGQPIILHKQLPIFLGAFEHQQTEVDFLVICSDLQGAVENDDGYQLLGEALPEYLRLLFEVELEIDNSSQIGILLCGDMFTSLNKRGSSGDVRNVWFTFEQYFNWVVGVAGNHDRFGNDQQAEEFKSSDHLYLLHKEVKKINNLTIGGISGIIGRADKTNRVGEEDYLNGLSRLLKQDIDIILLHETPDFPELKLKGNPKIREVIEKGTTNIICCGHCHWRNTLVEFENKSKVMNVDSKVVILQRKSNLSEE